MVQHGMPDDEVEGVVGVGDRLGVGDPALDLEAETAALRTATSTMPGDRSVTWPSSRTPGLLEVEQEEARAAAELESRGVGPAVRHPRRGVKRSRA